MQTSVSRLLLANEVVMLCALFYLAWWLIVFRPPAPKQSAAGTICLILAVVFGLAAMVLAARGFETPREETRQGLSPLTFFAGAAGLYLVLLLVTAKGFHRQVTSELLIIVVWGMFEAMLANALWVTETVTPRGLAAIAVIIVLSVAVSLVCYVLYYRVSYVKSYVHGTIPLLLAVVMTGLIDVLARRGL